MTFRWPYQARKVRMHYHCRGHYHSAQTQAISPSTEARIAGLSVLDAYRWGYRNGYQRRMQREKAKARAAA